MIKNPGLDGASRPGTRRSCGQVIGVLCAASLFLFPISSAAGQNRESWSRSGRVVLYSPHFDEPDPAEYHFACSPKSMRLYGFEHASATGDSVARLAVRVFHLAGPEKPGYVPLPEAVVQLTHRIIDGIEEALPLGGGFAGSTGPDGLTHLRAAPGIYRVKVMGIRHRTGEGLIQMRALAADSLHAYVHQSAVCRP